MRVQPPALVAVVLALAAPVASADAPDLPCLTIPSPVAVATCPGKAVSDATKPLDKTAQEAAETNPQTMNGGNNDDGGHGTSRATGHAPSSGPGGSEQGGGAQSGGGGSSGAASHEAADAAAAAAGQVSAGDAGSGTPSADEMIGPLEEIGPLPPGSTTTIPGVPVGANDGADAPSRVEAAAPADEKPQGAPSVVFTSGALTTAAAVTGAGTLGVFAFMLSRRETWRFALVAIVAGLLSARLFNEKARQQVLDAVRRRPGITYAELREATGVGRLTLVNSLRTLEANRAIRTFRKGSQWSFQVPAADAPRVRRRSSV